MITDLISDETRRCDEARRSNEAKPVMAAKLLSALFLLCSVAIGLASAQTPVASSSISNVDSYTPDELREKAEALKQAAEQSGSGSATVVLGKYPGHTTVLAFRDRSGGAELHKEYADIDVVLDGTCTLIVGGTIADAKTTGPGEVRGQSIQGGESKTLHQGDILHIPANTPHQMQLPPGGTLTYLVIKALEPSGHD